MCPTPLLSPLSVAFHPILPPSYRVPVPFSDRVRVWVRVRDGEQWYRGAKGRVSLGHPRCLHSQSPLFVSVLHCPQGPGESPQWGAADAEIKVPSGENTELKRSPFKAWSRSVYSHTCHACCCYAASFLISTLPVHSPPFFSKTSPDFLGVGCG